MFIASMCERGQYFGCEAWLLKNEAIFQIRQMHVA
jgi:hypothetical protein